MITIDQLLESVDLDFEPRFVTKDKDGDITVFVCKPTIEPDEDYWSPNVYKHKLFGSIKLSEFSDKDWTECIYEVPRKTTGKIGKLGKLNVSSTNMTMNRNTVDTVVNTLNQVIDAVNELKENKGV